MLTRRPARLLAPALAAVLVLGLAACGDDDGGDDAAPSTTEAAGTTDPATDGPTTSPDDAPDDGSGPTGDPDVTTTSPNLAPNDSPLQELLLAPSEIGEGYAPDDALGDGSFEGDFCEGVTVEDTSEDHAGQALLQGDATTGVLFNETVMRFADDAAAQAFATEVVDAMQECGTGAEAEGIDVGDQSVLVTTPSGMGATGSVVQVGDLVDVTITLVGGDAASPLDEAMVGVIADRLSA